MLLKEWTTGRKNMAFDLHIQILWKYDATVTINQHEYDIMELYDEHDRLYYIPNSIDLERYADGTKVKWEYEHHPAILSCDVNRLEKLPAHIIWAMPGIVKNIPDARLNLFALSLEPIATFRNIFCKAKNRQLEAMCENIQLKNRDLRMFMAGGDIGFNNNMSGILSRVGMEMMVHGVPIVAYNGEYTRYKCRIWDLGSIAKQITNCWQDLTAKGSTLREETREYAFKNFDRSKEVKKYVELYEKLYKKKFPHKQVKSQPPLKIISSGSSDGVSEEAMDDA
jgi:glycosyltransferase involved in cell wall biosynthesis